MKNSRLITFLLIIFLIGDVSFSFIQYYNTPLFGDMASHILPDKEIQKVFDDPLGFDALTTGIKHTNPNRFFSHLFLKEYFQHVPFWLQKLTNPINAVYLASSIFKITIQIIFLFLIAAFISSGKKLLNKKFLYSAILVAPLFQVYGFWSRMGIVDQSVAYTFFYGLPLVLLMLFFSPVFELLYRDKKMQPVKWIFILPLTIILPLSGPLIPAVILIVSFLIFGNFWLHSETKNLRIVIKSIPRQFYILLLPICILSLYSLFLGFYNSNNDAEMISLWERFKRLPEGLYSQVFHSLGFPLMILIIGINMFIIKRNNYPGKEKFTRILIWIGVFALIYILFLPFGGYRPYRPLIIRYDTFIPVNIALFYFFGATTYLIIHQIKEKKRNLYLSGIVIYLLLLTVADFKGMGRNKCERAAFEKMAASNEEIVSIPNGCYVLGWDNEFDYRNTKKKAELIHFWGITKEKKLFYNEP